MIGSPNPFPTPNPRKAAPPPPSGGSATCLVTYSKGTERREVCAVLRQGGLEQGPGIPPRTMSKKASRGSWASEAPGSRPAASQPPACVSSAGPPRCRCPAAPAAPASAGSPGPPCCGRTRAPSERRRTRRGASTLSTATCSGWGPWTP